MRERVNTYMHPVSSVSSKDAEPTGPSVHRALRHHGKHLGEWVFFLSLGLCSKSPPEKTERPFPLLIGGPPSNCTEQQDENDTV